MPKNRGPNTSAPRARGGRGRGAGRGRGRGGGVSRPSDEMDFVLQIWPENQEPNSAQIRTPPWKFTLIVLYR